MTDLPEPLTPPDCDLRGYDFMPLQGKKLFNSHLYRKSIRDPRAGLAAIKLWWVAWQECPAGSLPDDDEDLAMLADFSLDVKAWKKARPLALHGFIKCSDGRLYHPLICEVALDSYAKKLKGKAKRNADAERLRLWREARRSQQSTSDETPNGGDNSSDETAVETRFTTRVEHDLKLVREGEGNNREKKEVRAEAIASDADASPAVPDAREKLWSDGLPILQRLTGKPPDKCRPLLGRMLRDLHDDCPRALTVLHQAEEARPADPVAWLTRAVAPQQALPSRPAINGATQLRREAEARGEKLAEIPW